MAKTMKEHKDRTVDDDFIVKYWEGGKGKMDKKIIKTICVEMSTICKMLAKREKDEKQKEVFLKKAEDFKNLSKLKQKNENNNTRQ